MAATDTSRKLNGLASRLATFVAERHPLALGAAVDAFSATAPGRTLGDEHDIDALRPGFRRELMNRLKKAKLI